MYIILSVSIRKHSPQKQRRTEEHEKSVHLLKYAIFLIITNKKKKMNSLDYEQIPKKKKKLNGCVVL